MNATCEAILMRQFDADCDAAKPLPTDVAQHLSGCPSCQQAWAEAFEMDRYLQSHLKETPANHLYRRSYIAAVSAEHNTDTLKWFWWRQSAIALLIGLAAGGATHVFAELSGVNWLNLSVFVLTSTVVFLLNIMWQLREVED